MMFNIFSFLTCLICEELVKIFTTKAFYQSMYLVPIFVSTLLFVHTITAIAKPQITFAEKLNYLLPSSFTSLVVNVLLNIILIPKYGVVGAVFATLLANILSNLVLFYFAQKLYPLPINYKFLLGQFMLFILFLFPIYFLMNFNIEFYFKLPIKILLASIYIFVIVKFSYVKKEKLLSIWNYYKPKSVFQN